MSLCARILRLNFSTYLFPKKLRRYRMLSPTIVPAMLIATMPQRLMPSVFPKKPIKSRRTTSGIGTTKLTNIENRKISMFVSFVVPIPEVVLLLLIGFFGKTLGINLWGIVAISIAGTIVGDNILYRLSFFGNRYVEKFSRKMRAHKLIQYEHLVVDNIGKTIFF